jgi:hypothetical protein
MTMRPEYTETRRAEDKLVVPMFYVGVLCLLIAGGLAGGIILTKGTFTTPTMIVIAFFAGGGMLLMPTHRVLSALRAWQRQRHGGGTPP